MKNVFCSAMFCVLACTLFCALAFSCLSCSTKKVEKSEFMSVSERDSLASSLLCALGEDIDFLSGDVRSFDAVNDNLFCVATEKSAFLYNKTGKQLAKLSDAGNGPGEWTYIKSIFASSRYIYLHCEQQAKLIVFNFDGEFVKEYKNLDREIVRFATLDDEVFYFTKGVGAPEDVMQSMPFIEEYNLETNTLVREIDQNTPAGLMLQGLPACGLAVAEGAVYYTPVNEVKIREYKDNKIDTIACVYDTDFVRIDFEDSKHNEDFHSSLEYVSECSVVRDIHVYGGKLYILVDVGDLDLNQKTGKSTRHTMMYTYNINEGELSKVNYKKTFSFTLGLDLTSLYKDKVYRVVSGSDGFFICYDEL